jgi:hypothetical protein
MRQETAALLVATAVAAASCTPVPRPAGGALDAMPGPIGIVIWSARDLPSGLGEQVAAVPGVQWVTRMAVGMVDLAAVEGGSRPLPPREPGGILPVSVAALEPSPEPDDEVSRTLRAGEAVVSATAAALRGIAPGTRLTIAAGRARRTFRVGAVVPDERSRMREILIPLALADGLGLTAPRAILASIQPGRVAEALRRLEGLTAGLPVRIRPLEGGEPDPDEARLLPFAEVKRIFGELTYRPGRGLTIRPHPSWVEANIVQVRIPLLGLVACNRRIVPQLVAAMEELRARGLAGLVRSYDGCYAPRMQVGNAYALSRHAYGIAVDLNARWNRYGEAPTQDPRLVEVMERWGFTWGGRWLVPDGMHFEFSRFVDAPAVVTPAARDGAGR